MLDYSPALIKQLVIHSHDQTLSNNDRELLNRVANGLHKSPKFILPTGGFRNIAKISTAEIELFKPPYEDTVWEYYYPEQMQREDAIERGGDISLEIYSIEYRVCMLMENRSRNHVDNDWLFAIFNRTKNGKWDMHPCSVGFNADGIKCNSIDTNPDYMDYVESKTPDNIGINVMQHELHKDTRYELATVIKAIALLNCENVGHEQVNRPISRLKKNRFKKKYGLEPYQYRVLSIGGERTYGASGDINPRGAGVRFHLRRGHFRKLHSGKTIWVRACKVGDVNVGTVDKVYKLK